MTTATTWTRTAGTYRTWITTSDGRQVPGRVTRVPEGFDAVAIKLAGAHRARTGHTGAGAPVHLGTHATAAQARHAVEAWAEGGKQ